MKQEIIADLSRITEEEQAILDGKTEVEKERYSSGQKFVMDAGKLLERGKLIDIRPHTRFIRFPAHSHNYALKHKSVQFTRAARFCLLFIICILIGITSLPQNQHIISISNLRTRVANISQIRK